MGIIKAILMGKEESGGKEPSVNTAQTLVTRQQIATATEKN